MLIGLISDTHSLMRADALAALHGVELILHAGDVGAYSVIRELQAIASVHAVCGNVDDPVLGLPPRIEMTLDGLRIHVSHGHEMGHPTPAALVHHYVADIIVFGHTHRPLIQRHGAALVINPGAAGPRRFNLRPSIALLRIENRHASAELVPLA